MKKLKILVGCEESQAVTIELRKLGHDAFSCDLLHCSGGYPEYHFQKDIFEVIKVKKWDLIIAFPPCTYLSNAGACRLYPQKGTINYLRYEKGMEAKDFFMRILNSDCEFIALENPVSSKIFKMPKHSQEIQPFEYGHPYKKKTRLWLKNLPNLKPTKIITDNVGSWVNAGSKDHLGNARKIIGKKVSKLERSKTFQGIAEAMAKQWTQYILK